MKKYTVETFFDGQDVVMPIPQELTKLLMWKEGDTLQWDDNKDGSFTLKKVETPVETEIVLVETIMMYRMRYAVEVPKGKPEYALDTVTCELSNLEFKEFSQRPLEEVINSHRVVSNEELLKIFDEDNEYLKSWSNERKLNSVVNKWKSQGIVDQLQQNTASADHSEFWYDTERNR